MAKAKTPPLKEKMEDVARASSIVNKAIQSCQGWDHYPLVDEAIEKMREAQQSLKRQYEEWLRDARKLGQV